MATVLQLLAAQTQTPPAQTIFANVILDSGISTVFVRKVNFLIIAHFCNMFEANGYTFRDTMLTFSCWASSLIGLVFYKKKLSRSKFFP